MIDIVFSDPLVTVRERYNEETKFVDMYYIMHDAIGLQCSLQRIMLSQSVKEENGSFLLSKISRTRLTLVLNMSAEHILGMIFSNCNA